MIVPTPATPPRQRGVVLHEQHLDRVCGALEAVIRVRQNDFFFDPLAAYLLTLEGQIVVWFYVYGGVPMNLLKWNVYDEDDNFLGVVWGATQRDAETNAAALYGQAHNWLSVHLSEAEEA